VDHIVTHYQNHRKFDNGFRNNEVSAHKRAVLKCTRKFKAVDKHKIVSGFYKGKNHKKQNKSI
jgi:hypothetical protein